LNLDDAQIREIAATNGVIGVTAVHGTLAPGRTATMKHLVRQILYLARVAGPEHVALGMGFERLAADLHDAGMCDGDIQRVFYKNVLRVLCAPRAAPGKSGH
jgi:microsomal dipeptidase-like Zn-dependent dipeptidase